MPESLFFLSAVGSLANNPWLGAWKTKMALSSAMLMALAAVAVTDGPHTDLELLVAQCAALLAAVDPVQGAERSTHDRFVLRHGYERGDVVMWDNYSA